jgi:prevent-host-death family protein
MSNRTIGAAQFKAQCLSLLDEVQITGETLTVTKRGKPVVIINPAPNAEVRKSLFGSLATPGYRFDDPFSPATDPMDWEANR